MTVLNHTIADAVLDALDSAPMGSLEGDVSWSGRLATIQWLSAETGRSDSATRMAVMDLLNRNLVVVFTGTDPLIHRRRLYVSGGR